jgi:hypothetical protein
MRAYLSTLLSLVSLVAPAWASRHPVQVQVLSAMSQNVSGVGVGIGLGAGSTIPPGGDVARTMRCPLTSPTAPGTTYRCIDFGATGNEQGTVQNRRVEAIITAADGRTYYVILGCQRQYGWCTSLTDRATYVGELNDRSKWLEDYQHRPVRSFTKISLHLGGKKKVTYQIEYAVRVKLVENRAETQK